MHKVDHNAKVVILFGNGREIVDKIPFNALTPTEQRYYGLKRPRKYKYSKKPIADSIW